MSSTWRFKNWIAASWDRLSSGRHILLGIEQWIFRETSPYQEVAIARVPELGRGLFLDGVVQFLELDEYIYHEHLALPPLLFHPRPRRVLIEGGGDGLALREVLRDQRVEEALLVDIDGLVVEACRTHLSELHRGSFDDPRARVVIADVVQYLSRDRTRFDVVLVDLIDAFDLAALSLYEKVLTLTKQRLAPSGIACFFGELALPSFRITPLYVGLVRSFRYVEIYRASIDSFGGDYGFLLASDGICFRETPTDVLVQRAQDLNGRLRGLVPEQFPSAFSPPPYLREHLQKALRHETFDVPEPPADAVQWIFPDEGN